MNRNRVLAMAMAICLLAGLLPVSVFAADCQHHTHDAACGYVAAVEGAACSHVCSENCYVCAHTHDAACGYAAATEETEEFPCGHVCDESCEKALACSHSHDAACGYIAAVEGAPCTYVCETCAAEKEEEASVEPTPVPCDKSETCGAAAHDEGCPLYVIPCDGDGTDERKTKDSSEAAVAKIGETDYASVTEAFAAAKPGDTITLLSSTTELITLAGKNIEGLTITAAESVTVNGILVDSKTVSSVDGLTLSGIRFVNAGFYFNCTNLAPFITVKNLTMTGCSFTASSNTDVLGNRLFDVGADSTGSNKFENITITGCTATGGFQGIRLNSLYGATISGNTISGVRHNAITLRAVHGGTVTVSYNSISNGGDRAFRATTIDAGATVAFNNNTITDTGDKDDGSNYKVNTDNGTVTFSGNTVDGAAWMEPAASVDGKDYTDLAAAVEAAEESGKPLELPRATTNTATITEAVTAVAGSTAALTVPVTVAEGTTATVELDNAIVKAVNALPSGPVVLEIQQEAGATEERAVYDITLNVGENSVHELGGTLTITLPLPSGLSGKNVEVYYLDGDTRTPMGAAVVGTTVVFTTDHLSEYEIAEAGDPNIWTGTIGATTLTGGTVDAPMVITIDGEVAVAGTITVNSGYVKIVGDTTDGADVLKKGFGDANLFDVPNGAYLTVENLTIDGGAVWGGETNATLNRGTVNSGFSGGNMVKNDSGYVLVKNCTLQNHDGGQVFNCDKENYKDTLYVDSCKIINCNGGGIWTRSYATFVNTEIASISGNPSVFRPCTNAKITIKNCDIHHNYGTEENGVGVIAKWSSCTVTVDDTKFHNNFAPKGAVMECTIDAPIFTNCEFTDNTASQAGGVFYLRNANGVRLHGNTVISGNSAPKGSAVYTEKWFVLEANSVATVADNTGSAAIYMANGENTVVQILGQCTFFGNTDGDLYVEAFQSIIVNESISDLSISAANLAKLAIGRSSDSVDLGQVVGKIHYNGTVAEDTAVVPFVKSDGSAIQFATVVLNADEGHDAAILPFTTLSVNTLPTPEKDHHIFDGWYTDAELQEPLGEAELVAGSTYYAKYTKSGYAETLEANRTFDFGTITYGDPAPDARTFTFQFEPSDSNPNEAASVKAVTVTEAFDATFSGAAVTIQPKANVNAGVYDEVIYVTVHDDSVHRLYAKLTVNKTGSTTQSADQQTVSGTYGQPLTLSVNVAKAESGIMLLDLDEPEQDTVAFYCGETLLGEAAVIYTDDSNTSGIASLAYDTARGGIPVASGTEITVAYGGSINLLDSDGTITVDLAPAALTVSGLVATDRVYDGTTNVEVTGGVLDGVVGEDEVSVSAVTASVDKNAGEDKAVTISGVTLTGADANKYVVNLYPTDVTMDITPAMLTATYIGETIKYGETPKLTVKVEGFVTGETAATAEGYTAPAVTNSNTAVGKHGLTPSGGAAANYNFTYVEGTLVINNDYKIITGANQAVTRGDEALFRSDADFDKFVEVRVDGKVVDRSDYDLREGSTIVELHEDFVKSLSVGTHTLSIVSEDGQADTGFTVEAQTVVVHFDANGGKTTPKDITVTVGQTYGKLPTITHDTLYFAGWYTAKTGGTKVTDTTVVTGESDHTLYAHWSNVPVTGDNSHPALWLGLLAVSALAVVVLARSGRKKGLHEI